jgi:Domain of unknown function (DUF4389)
MDHPVHLIVDDDLHRSRLTVFFRFLLVIPHLIVLLFWGIAVYVLAVVNWFVALFKGELPQSLHDFQATYLRYSCQVTAYYCLVANPYPPFGGGPYPVDLAIAPPVRQGRWTIFFRVILAIPAYILAAVLSFVLEVILFLAWFACLFMGRMPEGMRNLSAFCIRYHMQFSAYLLLLTPRYPSLSTDEGSSAPVATGA